MYKCLLSTNITFLGYKVSTWNIISALKALQEIDPFLHLVVVFPAQVPLITVQGAVLVFELKINGAQVLVHFGVVRGGSPERLSHDLLCPMHPSIIKAKGGEVVFLFGIVLWTEQARP